MAQLIEHVAIRAGTMSNPYRYVEKGETVHLTKDEAEFYKGSWLRPTKEGRAILDKPPDFPGIKATNSNSLSSIEALRHARISENYDRQMKAIIAAEKQADGIDEDSGEGAKAGTGNIDPLA